MSSNHRRGGGVGVGSGGRSGSRGGGMTKNNNLPWEDGIVCSLKESFGFIYCADRPDEVFFHYSQLNRDDFPSPSDLTLNQQVSFQVGPSKNDPNKLAAFHIRKCLQPIVWETSDTLGTGRVRGLVEKPSSALPGNNHNSDRPGVNHNTSLDGSIRLLIQQEQPQNTLDQEASPDLPQSTDNNNIAFSPDGPLIHFTLDDFRSDNNRGDRDSKSPPPAGPNRLFRGDLVEFDIFTDRRTKTQYARNIVLLLSEKERARVATEQKMLQDATLEHGVITSLKGDYGFLKSNKRREEVFFHYSSIQMHDGDDGASDVVLQEGQDMKFFVVTEGGAGERPGFEPRISARQVTIQPRGSVQFYDTVAKCHSGVVLYPPQPHDSGHLLDQHGKIRLHKPVLVLDSETGEQRQVNEVYLHIKDAPGGSFAFRGGTSVGMWVQAGDNLLFDVVQDYVDGTCHAGPTASLTPTDTEATTNEKDPPAVRLIQLALAMRAEGVINAVKDSYGFLHYAERPVDVHFKLFQVLPDPLQRDLRRNILGYEDKETRPLKLEVGTEVSFDLSVHGMIHHHTVPPSTANQHNKTNQRAAKSSASQERENLKAQRILFLPPKTVVQNHILGASVEAIVLKQDAKQPFAGLVELCEPLFSMTLEQRHPLVAKMLDDYMNDENALEPMVFHDIQTHREDEVVFALIEKKYPGRLSWRHTTEADKEEKFQPFGKLVLTKGRGTAGGNGELQPAVSTAESDDDCVKSIDGYASSDVELEDDNHPSGEHEKGNKQKKKTASQRQDHQVVKTVRYDKGGMSNELKKESPPNVGDKVIMDVKQSRRTGVVSVSNMKILRRKETPHGQGEIPDVQEPTEAGESVGIVTEVVPSRKNGHISVLDETAARQEVISFSFSSIDGGKSVRKGDEVKFQIHAEKSGKRVAQHISILPRGTIPVKNDKNACQGIVLLQPTHTELKEGSKLHHAHSSSSAQSTDSSSRWESGDESVKEVPIHKQGCILLTTDPTGMFANGEEKKIPFHLYYKNGAIAIHGSGSASSGVDDGSYPRRGDLVSFFKTKNKEGNVRDVRIIERGAANLLRGVLTKISIDAGLATFDVTSKDEATSSYEISLSEIVGCQLSVLKEGVEAEAILYQGSLFGISRTADLYLSPNSSTSSGAKKKERTRLNLTVKKDRGGTIIAQSMMAKGPDGTNGFAPGWTTRVSKNCHT